MPQSSVPNTARQSRASRSVRRYADAVWWVPFTYVLLGLLALSAPNYEVLPFFSWFLFPVTPTTVTRFGLQLQHAEHESMDTWFEQDRHLGTTRHSMDAQVLIQALGNAIERTNAASVHQARETLEGNFLPPPCRYALFKRTYDPVKRWLNRADAASNDEQVATFECGKP